MYNIQMNISRPRIAIGLFPLFAICLLIGACTSRYRMDLYLVDDLHRYKMQVDQTAFARGTRLNSDPYGVPKVVVGDKSTVMIATGRRGAPEDRVTELGIGIDEYIIYRIYLELPADLTAGEVPLIDNSFVRLMKYFEIPADEKIFLPVSGQFTIDSVRSGDLFGTFTNARWENQNGIPVGFAGRVRFKVD